MRADVASVELQVNLLQEQLDNNKLKEAELGGIFDVKRNEMEDKSRDLKALEDEVTKIKTQLVDRENDMYNFSRDIDTTISSNHFNAIDLDRNLVINDEEEVKVKKLEDEYAGFENEASFVRADVEKVRASHKALDETYKELETSLDAYGKHSHLLESQNIELSKELDNVIMSDK